jgi:hypothetical protein
VFKFDGKQPSEIDGKPSHPGDSDQRVRIGSKDLFHMCRGDAITDGGTSITGHDHAVGKA